MFATKDRAAALSALCLLTISGPITTALDHDRPGIIEDSYTSPLPKTYIEEDDLPLRFSWTSVGGNSFLTKMLNQHIPQYCGACWAHSTVSVLADRIKIARGGQGEDINLAVQFLLNCGAEKAGSCQGGSALRAFKFIRDFGYIPYDTCQGYLACSSNSTAGFCPHVDTSCSPMNICRTCTNPMNNGTCAAITRFPNATVAEYGTYELDVHGMKAEIFARGPVKASVNAGPLMNYTGGILYDSPVTRNTTHNHGISIVGWGMEKTTNTSYWIVRNSWGEYYGELGFFRVEMGKNLLGIEAHVAWATPGTFSVNNFPCDEDGSNCDQNFLRFRDPSTDLSFVKRRLRTR